LRVVASQSTYYTVQELTQNRVAKIQHYQSQSCFNAQSQQIAAKLNMGTTSGKMASAKKKNISRETSIEAGSKQSLTSLSRRTSYLKHKRAFVRAIIVYVFIFGLALVFIQLRNSLRFDAISSESNNDDGLDFTHMSNLSVVSELFNDSCHVDLLGLPKSVASICSDDDSSALCRNLTCRNLLSGQFPELYSYARDFMGNHTYQPFSDFDFISLTKNCKEFKQQRGFDKKLFLKDDADFPIAFNFIVHRSVEQIERLLYTLYRPQHQFCIHLDLKAPNSTFEALQGIAQCLSNVFLASTREFIIYQGYSRLKADVTCMADHLRRKTQWKYLINTAGEALPLRSNHELITILKSYNGSNDVEGIFGKSNDHLKSRYVHEYVESMEERAVKRTNRENPPPPHEIQMVKGSSYGAFSRGFVEYAVNDKKARDLFAWLRTTWTPDELFWSTLHHRYVNPHMNVPGGYAGFPSQTHFTAVYANWAPDSCRGRVVHTICINGVEDLPPLLRRHELFVNKFYADFEPLGSECMRAWIEHKNVCPVRYNYEFYKQLSKRDAIE
jgi:beta-1,3-galactosyl-O-glycosyl-glycoprotein beta-1,6-N-acetylglucosaminyltransferase/N-acetyllactosaminide beta-1,6-N-acetylglucosaminyltransferase/mucin type N-acetylglucosaminyltransferase 3